MIVCLESWQAQLENLSSDADFLRLISIKLTILLDL